MKKLLLSTSVLTLSSLFSVVANAEGLSESTRYLQQNDLMGQSSFEFKLRGYGNFFAGYADNNMSDIGGAPVDTSFNEFDIMMSGGIHFDYTAKMKNGVNLGAKVRLNSWTDDDVYISADNKMGQILVGIHDNVNEMLSVRAVDVGALGIQESELDRFVVNPLVPILSMGVVSGAFPTGTAATVSVLGNAVGASYFTIDKDFVKISYISPIMNGFQMGVSYTPQGISNDKEYLSDNFVSNMYSLESTVLTAVYSGEIKGVNFSISGGFNRANTYNIPNFDGFNEWNVGGRISYKNISLMGAYKVNNDIGLIGDIEVFDVGVVYEDGSYALSLSYMESDLFNVIKSKTMLASGKYNIYEGIDVFASVGWSDYAIGEGADTIGENDGFAVISGLMLSF